MSPFKRWLTNKFSRDNAQPASTAWQSSLRASSKLKVAKAEAVEPLSFESGITGQVKDGGPGKNVLMRSKYVREETGTHETLKIIGLADGDLEDDGGMDPYNSGRFDRSKSWGSYRSRK